MGFCWTKEKIQLYKRAAEYTEYNSKLGEIIVKHIGENRTIYDIGCGMSYLSMYLSKYQNKIHCIDIDENIIKSFQEEINNRNINNIKIHLDDYKVILDKFKKVDCIITSHFLNMNKDLNYLLEKANNIIIIKNVKKSKGLYRLEKQKIEDVEELLKEKCLEYKKIIYTGDFGQPLKNIDEAISYYNSYTGENLNEEEIMDILEMKSNDLYPYYISKNKSTGIIIIGGNIVE